MGGAGVRGKDVVGSRKRKRKFKGDGSKEGKRKGDDVEGEVLRKRRKSAQKNEEG